MAEHGRLLRKKTDDVLFLYDGDQAGNDGALSAGRILTEKGINTLVGELPSGQDPAEIIHSQGIDAFKKSIKISTYKRLEMRDIL
ncbi:toprim domain-containing protein [Paenibacillus terrae]|uniref:toprim domain-containing protein n=1 Tax=Paenibacillus terrae TaxID=159743 RepID=UPI000697A1BE|nr:toprim domain-containing protein [Paenibacillus terrae]